MIRAAVKALAGLALVGAVFGCTSGFEGDRGDIPLTSAATTKLERMGSSPAAPMFIRIYKQESELEVWKMTSRGSYELFSTYEICAWSGGLGPKVREGDRQTPEGFYTVTPGLMNPRSQYHLAINLGFPNAFDRSLDRTGSNIMIHGDCSSRGCYAMTDEQIEEIYALARETFEGGNRSFQVQVYPFRMTAENLAQYQEDPNISFWNNLREGYEIHQAIGAPPDWNACEGQYTFETDGACGPSRLGETARIRLASIQAEDAAALSSAIAARQEAERKAAEEEAQRVADAAAAEQRQQERVAAAEDRREAAAGFASNVGSFFGGLFGRDSIETAQLVEDPNAPIPPPRPAWLS